jgi:hypothetical protein
MSRFEKIKEYLSNNFDGLDKVLKIELRDNFSVIDYNKEGSSFIIIDIKLEDNTFTICDNKQNIIQLDFDETKIFNIKNAKIIGFIPIDGKSGLEKFGQSHCDFVFFDERDFCFVEFKLNATSSEVRAVKKNREKAIAQLKNTIALFNHKLSKNYQDLKLEAYVCTPETYPRANTSWQELELDFLEEVRIPLFESNEKICR